MPLTAMNEARLTSASDSLPVLDDDVKITDIAVAVCLFLEKLELLTSCERLVLIDSIEFLNASLMQVGGQKRG